MTIKRLPTAGPNQLAFSEGPPTSVLVAALVSVGLIGTALALFVLKASPLAAFISAFAGLSIMGLWIRRLFRRTRLVLDKETATVTVWSGVRLRLLLSYPYQGCEAVQVATAWVDTGARYRDAVYPISLLKNETLLPLITADEQNDAQQVAEEISRFLGFKLIGER